MGKRIRPTWWISENEVTPESVYKNRRKFLKTTLAAAGSLTIGPRVWGAQSGFPARVNPDFKPTDPDRPLTPEKLSTQYNNFYEFSLEKDEVHERVKSWKLDKWTVTIGGLVKNPRVWDVEDLVKKFQVEERIYRFRCVEAWSMVVPWDGFPLEKLIQLCGPKPDAKYVKFTTFDDPKIGPNIKMLPYYPWPYVEGLTIEEARHPLTFMATGMYGKSLPKQNGAPIRLVVPWKYGFKSIKSIVKIEFVKERPVGLWEALAPKEYGFYANVNPKVDHPRWTQAKERILNGKLFPTKIPTLLFNGYEKEVAHLYKNLDLVKNY